jgi:4-oxalocrotonate tautomerase
MPFVTVKMLEGRTKEQKQELVKAITDAIVNTCDAPPEHTMVVIEEVSPAHWAREGILVSDR